MLLLKLSVNHHLCLFVFDESIEATNAPESDEVTKVTIKIRETIEINFVTG